MCFLNHGLYGFLDYTDCFIGKLKLAECCFEKKLGKQTLLAAEKYFFYIDRIFNPLHPFRSIIISAFRYFKNQEGEFIHPEE